MERIVFLGTAGGRIATVLQARATGGIVLQTDEHQVHIDPGPGAVLRCKQYGVGVRDTDILCLSHCHMDHTTDVCVIAEGMSNFGKEKDAVLVMSKSCSDKQSSVVPDYYISYFKRALSLSPGDNVEFENMKLSAMRCKHSDPTGMGFIFKLSKHTVGYTSDTEYFEGLSTLYSGCDVVIFNVLRPGSERISWHLCTDDVIKVIKEMENKPRLIIITHFGMKMLRSNPLLEARRIFSETRTPVMAASDGHRVDIGAALGAKKLMDF